MIRTDYDDLIEALDNYKNVQAKRGRDLDTPRYYDPCDSQKEFYERDLWDAEKRLNDVFRKLVRRHQRGCGCPDQELA